MEKEIVEKKACVMELVSRGSNSMFLVVREIGNIKEVLGVPGGGSTEAFPGVVATVKPLSFVDKDQALALIERLSLNQGGSVGFAHLWGKMRFVGDCMNDLNGR